MKYKTDTKQIENVNSLTLVLKIASVIRDLSQRKLQAQEGFTGKLYTIFEREIRQISYKFFQRRKWQYFPIHVISPA